MRFTGAIFDCDGTLVDSMRMWHDVLTELGRRYAGDVPPDFFKRIESLSLWDEARVLHEECGGGESTQAVYDEICATVTERYVHEVQDMPGALVFLRAVRDAGIPMIVATSTPKREVVACLEAHGMAGFFVDVVSTEDVGGRDKDFPDVYEEALRRLGTDRASTWVFEDAPFGVRTARQAGFPVCALFNDHDGRDEAFLRRYADVFAHGFGEVTLELIADYERPVAVGGEAGVLRALVVDGSPEASSAGLVARLAGEADYVIAADRGAQTCRAAGVRPDVFCGDDDSVDGGSAGWARGAAGTDIKYPSEKYATDLAIAIDCARHEAARRQARLELTVTCAAGGRPDHALAVVGLLAGAADASAREVEDGFEMRVLSPLGAATWDLGEQALGSTFSAIALSEGARVTERGMRWETSEKELPLLGDEGVSNRVTATDARVTCVSGVIAAYLLPA